MRSIKKSSRTGAVRNGGKENPKYKPAKRLYLGEEEQGSGRMKWIRKKTKSKPSKAGSIWRGGATEQVRDDFFMRSIKKSSRTGAVRDDDGAGKGSRTLLSTLGRSRSTDELYPQICSHYNKRNGKKQPGFIDKKCAQREAAKIVRSGECDERFCRILGAVARNRATSGRLDATGERTF